MFYYRRRLPEHEPRVCCPFGIYFHTQICAGCDRSFVSSRLAGARSSELLFCFLGWYTSDSTSLERDTDNFALIWTKPARMPPLFLCSLTPACSSSPSLRSFSSSWKLPAECPCKTPPLLNFCTIPQRKKHYLQPFAITHSTRNNANVWAQSASEPQTVRAFEGNVRWVFEPLVLRRGNTSEARKAEQPSAFEMVSDTATVGGSAGKADIVIPLSTVSAYHTLLERRGEILYVTDLDSADGTYVDRKKLKANECKPILPGSYITFGDKQLAIFRFLKIEIMDDGQGS